MNLIDRLERGDPEDLEMAADIAAACGTQHTTLYTTDIDAANSLPIPPGNWTITCDYGQPWCRGKWRANYVRWNQDVTTLPGELKILARGEGFADNLARAMVIAKLKMWEMEVGSD